MDPTIDIALSCDGAPVTHDYQRRFLGGSGSSSSVLATLDRLRDTGRDFRVIMVVRPDNVAELARNTAYLVEQGVPFIAPSLDL